MSASMYERRNASVDLAELVGPYRLPDLPLGARRTPPTPLCGEGGALDDCSDGEVGARLQKKIAAMKLAPAWQAVAREIGPLAFLKAVRTLQQYAPKSDHQPRIRIPTEQRISDAGLSE